MLITIHNPHPLAYCEKCGAVKLSVAHGACSALCAEMLGVAPPRPVAPFRAWKNRQTIPTKPADRTEP